MESIYDKLGKMLNESMEKGFIQHQKKETNEESKESIVNSSEKQDNNSSSRIKILSQNDEKFLFCLTVLSSTQEDNEEGIAKNYRKLLKKYHPDFIPELPLMQETARKKTMEIMEAYEYINKKLSE